jgi:hypothetical protein
VCFSGKFRPWNSSHRRAVSSSRPRGSIGNRHLPLRAPMNVQPFRDSGDLHPFRQQMRPMTVAQCVQTDSLWQFRAPAQGRHRRGNQSFFNGVPSGLSNIKSKSAWWSGSNSWRIISCWWGIAGNNGRRRRRVRIFSYLTQKTGTVELWQISGTPKTKTMFWSIQQR